MTDYAIKVQGHFADGSKWSFGHNVSSNQSLTTMAGTASNAWVSAWTDGTVGLQTLYHTTTVLDDVSVASLTGAFKEQFKQVTTTSHAGTSSDTPLPKQNAVLVSLRSPSIQKFGRGRMYLPAPVEGIVVSGAYTSTACTRVTGAVGLAFSAFRADGSTIFVVSKKAHKDLSGQYVKTVITSHSTSNKPGAQTRRQNSVASVYF